MREERRAVVDHHRTPADARGRAHERDRIVARAADHQAERRFQHFDERADAVDEGPDLGALLLEQLARGEDRLDVEVRVTQGALDLALGGDHQAGAGGHQVGCLRLQDGHQADRPRFLQRAPERAGGLGRPVGGLDEDLDRAVATQAQPPDLVVVGGEVPPRQAGDAFLHHEAGHVGDVAFQAAAADVADRCAVLGHQQPGPGAPVRGAPNGHDRGERQALALRGQRLDGLQHVGDLTHSSIVRRTRAFRPGAPPADTSHGMSGDLGFGGYQATRAAAQPAPPTEAAPTARGGRGLRGRLLLLVGGLVVIALVAGFLQVMKSGGEAAADSATTALDQVDKAQDASAQVTLNVVKAQAMQLYAEGTDAGPSFLAADPEALAAIGRQYTYTAEASTGPTVVSVAATPTDWAAAVRSESGTCLWIHLTGTTVTQGQGETCTGQAAMAA